MTNWPRGGYAAGNTPASELKPPPEAFISRESHKSEYRRGLERAAEIADEMAEGVVNPEKPYNEAFIHACGVIARAIREDG